jgi:hypothetical protein
MTDKEMTALILAVIGLYALTGGSPMTNPVAGP